jgi:nucleotide-binding universal stress UspA family protein
MKVLIALDESEASLRAARAAVELFSPAGAEFLVINVATVSTAWVSPLGFGAVGPLPPSEVFRPEGLAAPEVEQRAEAVGVDDPEVLTTTGDPVRRICAAAEEHDVAVVVVGSHDRGGFSRLLDPSVAAGVVRGTYRPVLVVSGERPTTTR